jgi:hypothetical protein
VVFYIFDQTDFKATFGCFGVFGPSVFERNGERRSARSRRILVRSGRNRLVWIEGPPTGNEGRKRRKNFLAQFPASGKIRVGNGSGVPKTAKIGDLATSRSPVIFVAPD